MKTRCGHCKPVILALLWRMSRQGAWASQSVPSSPPHPKPTKCLIIFLSWLLSTQHCSHSNRKDRIVIPILQTKIESK